MRFIAWSNNWRSSALSIASLVAPIISTPIFLQHAFTGQVQGAVEGGLAAHGGQQGVGFFHFDNARHGLPLDRLDVGGVRHGRVGHDGGGIGVHQNDAIALLAQGLAGLGARVVELAGLADDDRPGAEDQDAVYVSALRHGGLLLPGPCGYQCNKMLEQRRRVVRAGTGFRMSLEAERRLVSAMHALQAAIEQGLVRDAQSVRQARLVNREAVILAGDQHRAVFNVLHRMVGAVMAKLHFDGGGATGQAQQLVPQANAEHRDIRCQECPG